jgi:DNA-binding NarL/FixJ family response regulator
VSPDHVHRRPDAHVLRVILVDGHEVSRAASRALLRCEGVEVVADLTSAGAVLAAVEALCPDVVVVDVSPGDRRAWALAWQLRELPSRPTVVLTSSSELEAVGSMLDGFAFVDKAELRCERILDAMNPVLPEG